MKPLKSLTNGEKMPKTKKMSKKKVSNVIPIKQDAVENKEDQLLSIEEQERERTNKFAKKLCDEIDEFVKECKMNADFTYYHFLYHIKQRTILNVSYGLFKHVNDDGTTVYDNKYNFKVVR